MKRIQELAHRGASRSGVAKVNIVWLIATFVLLVFALVGMFSGNSEVTDLRASLKQAEAARATAVENENKTSIQISELSRVVGFYDPEAPIPVTNLDALKSALDSYKQTFTDAGASVVDLEKLLPVMQQNYVARTREVQGLKDQAASLTSEKTTIEASLRNASQSKDKDLDALRRQLADAQETAARTQSALESQVTAAKGQATDLENALRASRLATEEEKRNLLLKTTEMTSRFEAMSAQLKFLKEPESADGAILAVSKGASMGWIDIGANQRVAAGMKFRVVSGRLGGSTMKCLAEVVKTEAGRAEVVFSDMADAFDPPVVGDVIFNPLLDPKGERSAVLVGRFSVPSENEVRGLLANMGITVQPKIDDTTDYLIVGGEIYVDADGTALEEPIQPSDTADYKEAQAKGVAITPLKDLRAYFKF